MVPTEQQHSSRLQPTESKLARGRWAWGKCGFRTERVGRRCGRSSNNGLLINLHHVESQDSYCFGWHMGTPTPISLGIGYALARKLPKTGAAAQSGQGARIVKSSSDEKKMTHGDWMSFACMSLLHPRVSKCRGLSAERIADPCLHIHAPWMCAIWHDAQHAIETTGSLLSTSDKCCTSWTCRRMSSLLYCIYVYFWRNFVQWLCCILIML